MIRGDDPDELILGVNSTGASVHDHQQHALFDGYRGEKSSCHRFVANAFRLVLYAIAYTMVVRFGRHHLSGTRLEDAWIETIHRKPFKLGARIEVSVRRLWTHASEDRPYQDLFKRVARSVRPQPG